MSFQRYDTDILIIGAGPAGLYGAYCAGFRGLRTVVIDSLEQVGGQVSTLYPEKSILDVAGIPEVSGQDLISNLLQQAMTYSPTILLGHHATTLDTSSPDRVVVRTANNSEINCQAVVLTAGIGAFTPRRLPAEAAWDGAGVHYHIPNPEAHRGQNVVVAGGGDSAVDWAHALAPVAKSVTLVHRRKGFRAHAANVARLADSGVRVIADCEIAEILGNGKLESLRLRTKGIESIAAVDSLVVALGFLSELGPIGAWGLALHGRSVAVDQKMRTSTDRVYAAGDLSEYDGKVRLIAVGFGEVANAIGNAAVDLGMSEALFPGHSTELESPTVAGKDRS